MPAVKSTKINKSIVLEGLTRDKGVRSKSVMSVKGLKEERVEKMKLVATTKDKRRIFGIARIRKTAHDDEVKKYNRWCVKGYYDGKEWQKKEMEKKIKKMKESWEEAWKDQQETLAEAAAKEK